MSSDCRLVSRFQALAKLVLKMILNFVYIAWWLKVTRTETVQFYSLVLLVM